MEHVNNDGKLDKNKDTFFIHKSVYWHIKYK